MGYFAQHAMEQLDGEASIFETLEGAFPQANQGSQGILQLLRG